MAENLGEQMSYEKRLAIELAKPVDYRKAQYYNDQYIFPKLEQTTKQYIGSFVRPTATPGVMTITNQEIGSCGILYSTDPIIVVWRDRRINPEALAEALLTYPELNAN